MDVTEAWDYAAQYYHGKQAGDNSVESQVLQHANSLFQRQANSMGHIEVNYCHPRSFARIGFGRGPQHLCK